MSCEGKGYWFESSIEHQLIGKNMTEKENKMITITLKEYEDLLESQAILTALENSGVDN